MAIGERIRSRRLDLDMTLEDVANLVGVTRATIQKYENSIIATIPYDRIIALAKALRVSPTWLMGWSEGENNSPSETKELSEAQKELISIVEQLPEDVCRALVLGLRQQLHPDDPDGQ